MKKVLVINLGFEQEPLIKRLSERSDCILYGIHYNKNPKMPEVFQQIKILNLRDLAGILKFAEEIKPDAVISDQCDYSLIAQSLIAEKFNLPAPSVESAQLSNNKFLQRIKAKENDILVPNFKLCITQKDIKDFTNKNGYPIIIKPIDNRGSFGVVKINKESEIKTAFFTAIINSHSRMLLVEEFISGTHYIVDGVTIDVEHCSLAVGEKKLAKNGFMNEDILYLSQDNELTSRLKINNNNNVFKLGYSFGCTSSEYIVDKDNNIFLVESSNRGGGVFISSDIVNNISGIDAVDAYISFALNIKNYKIKKVNRLDCIHLVYFIANKNGLVSQVNTGLLDGTLKYKIWKKNGDKVYSNLKNSLSRVGVGLFTEEKNLVKIKYKLLEIK